MHHNPLCGGLVQKSVAYEIPRGSASLGCGLRSFSRYVIVSTQSSHALSWWLSFLFFCSFLMYLCTILPLRMRNHPSVNYVERVIAVFNWHSHILLGRFAGRQSDCITWCQCLSNAFCYSLIYQCCCTCIIHNWKLVIYQIDLDTQYYITI